MGWILIALLIGPAVVTVICWFAPVKVGQALTVAAGVASFAASVALITQSRPPTALSGWLRADPLSIVFLLSVTFLYALTTIFAVGYLHAGDPHPARYSRWLCAGLNLFCWAMVMATIVNDLSLLWVAIEVTTVVSALLVAIDDTDGATEAAWKYVLIASMGLGIALLATIIMYYAGAQVFGSGYEMFYPKMIAGAAHFPAPVMRLSFVLAVLGFGTKMGLFPVHTWLPDAHSEAPTPVSALLSGSLLAVSFYAILRYFQITVRAVGPEFPRGVLLAFGLASLLLATLYLARQRDLKRLFAYSSVEHMGILAIGMSFASPIAIVGVLLHVLAHAAAKGTAFFGAGSFMKKFHTKDMSRISGGARSLPWSGPLLLAAFLGLCAAPPGGMFRSEFLIVSGGLSDSSYAAVAILVVLITLASFGLLHYASVITLGRSVEPVEPFEPVEPGETSWLMVTAMVLGIAGLVLLGVHPPASLSNLLTHAAAQLGTGR